MYHTSLAKLRVLNHDGFTVALHMYIADRVLQLSFDQRKTAVRVVGTGDIS